VSESNKLKDLHDFVINEWNKPLRLTRSSEGWPIPTNNEDEEKPEVTLFVHDTTRLSRRFMRCELRTVVVAVGCKRVGRRTGDNRRYRNAQSGDVGLSLWVTLVHHTAYA
jgi:hypothetical protein